MSKIANGSVLTEMWRRLEEGQVFEYNSCTLVKKGDYLYCLSQDAWNHLQQTVDAFTLRSKFDPKQPVY
jgi:hypothetical protein